MRSSKEPVAGIFPTEVAAPICRGIFMSLGKFKYLKITLNYFSIETIKVLDKVPFLISFRISITNSK